MWAQWSPGAKGNLTLNADGSFTYDRTDDTATGTDVFYYTVIDGDGDASTTTLTIDLDSDPGIVALPRRVKAVMSSSTRTTSSPTAPTRASPPPRAAPSRSPRPTRGQPDHRWQRPSSPVASHRRLLCHGTG